MQKPQTPHTKTKGHLSCSHFQSLKLKICPVSFLFVHYCSTARSKISPMYKRYRAFSLLETWLLITDMLLNTENLAYMLLLLHPITLTSSIILNNYKIGLPSSHSTKHICKLHISITASIALDDFDMSVIILLSVLLVNL